MTDKKDKNGYDIILETYNSHKYPIIENQMNALVFPWNMQRDVDAIDSVKLSQGPKNAENHLKEEDPIRKF